MENHTIALWDASAPGGASTSPSRVPDSGDYGLKQAAELRLRPEIRLQGIPVEQRAPVLRRYLGIAPGARPHFPVAHGAPLADFERIAAGYPVFRVTYPVAKPTAGGISSTR